MTRVWWDPEWRSFIRACLDCDGMRNSDGTPCGDCGYDGYVSVPGYARARRIHRRTLRRAARAWDRRHGQGKGRTET